MRVSLVNIALIVGSLALVLGVTLLAMRLVRWRRDVALRRHGAPILVMPIGTDEVVAPRPVVAREEAAPGRGMRLPRITPEAPVAVRRMTPPAARAHADDPADLDPALPDDNGDAIDTGPFRPSELRPGSPSAHLVHGNQVRFFRAEEGTLEFLPGRLEVVGGEDIGQEIHFARQVGEEGATITFGRSEGQPLRHIQLLDPTVSRQHARMSWDGQYWQLLNLSSTNAVVHNGMSMDGRDGAIALQEGDRIEMGAVVFVFHSR